MEHDILTKEEARKMIDEIMDSEHTVTDWEEQFLENIYNSVIKHLSPKQTAKLWAIYTKI